MLKEVLKGNILIKDKVNDWKDAVRLGASPLLDKNIEPRYIEAMIENIQKLGPYIILNDGVAMPHARPEDGVLETGLALLVLKEGVSFSQEEELVHLIFVLAAKDNSSHIDIIKSLADLIDDDELILEIAKQDTVDKVLNLIKN